MTFTRQIQGKNTYLIYEIQAEDQIDTLSLGMIVNNKIEGIVPAIYNQLDNQRFLKYNISSKVSLKQYFADIVSRQRLINVFESILEGLTSAEDYMLQWSSILLNMENIFVDVSTGRASLICIPILKTPQKQLELGIFFKEIMFNTQFDQNENGDYIAKILGYLNSTAQMSVEDFQKLLKGLIASKQSLKPQQNKESLSENVIFPIQQPPVIQRQITTQPQPSIEPNSQETSVSKFKEGDVGLAIPEGNTALSESVGKKDKKIKDKKDKKKKEFLKKEKPQKEKKGFSLFGKKKKDLDIGGESKSDVTQSPEIPLDFLPVQPPKNAPVAPPIMNKTGSESITNRYENIPINMGNVGETMVLGNGNIGETMVLSDLKPKSQANPYLIRVCNNEQIAIHKQIFRIGKERSYVDYFIGDNPAISRSHANIMIQEDGYYIEDMNSTNHTFVNGQMIVGGLAVKLEQGTKIRLGDEEFIFRY